MIQISPRQEAKIKNLKKYFTGKPCKYGHISMRNTSTGQCNTCLDNLYKLNKEYFIKKANKWKKENPGKRLKIVKNWKDKNKDYPRIRDHRRRARKKNSVGNYTFQQIKDLFKKQKNLCMIMPLALGGSNDIKNLQLLCPTCNMKKSAKHPVKWAQENGRLL